MKDKSIKIAGTELEASTPASLKATNAQPQPPAQDVESDVVETGFETPKRIGLTIAFLVFGVFGLWSAFAPIDGAANAQGVITVKSYKKVIQHLEGGIVKNILIQNGDEVMEGETLLVMDSTQSLAQLEIQSSQLMALQALEARLIAERDNLDSITYPAALLNGSKTSQDEINAQNQIFKTRRNSREGAIAVLDQRINQLNSRVDGLKALLASKSVLAESYEDELKDFRSLLAEGFADKQRLRELERHHAQLAGEAAELQANIASTEIQVGETQLEILQKQNEFQNEVANILSDTQSRIKDANERITALSDVVSRTEIKAPVAGIINGFQIHTIGGVINPGMPIAEIVPMSDELIIEARVLPMDIDRVAVEQQATVRMSAFNSKSVPTLYGTVLSISADALEDQATGGSYYLARIEITPESLADLNEFTLVPGMPAEVLIKTGSRTFLQYILKPLSSAMARSFIED